MSGQTIKAAVVQLRAEGLVTTHQGRGVFVSDQPAPLIRTGDDITYDDGFYTSLKRAGLTPASKTTVSRGPASDEVAESLGVPAGTEVVIRARVLRTEGEPPISLATSYYPLWVAEAAPNLENPQISGQPRWFREAFGPFYSEDVIDVRTATEDEAQKLQIPPGSPVFDVRGITRDQQHRTLHYIRKITAAGRMSLHYRYGIVPDE
jgi:GntR family transcriptional regulator